MSQNPVNKDLDLITIGRSSVDLYGQQIGGRLEDMASFSKAVGGCPTNIAIGAARLGLKTALITRVGDEAMGRFIREDLVRNGVDVSGVKTDPARLTALVLLGVRDEHAFPLIFYRSDCADAALEEADVDPVLIARAGAVLVTGTHFARENTAAAQQKAMRLAKENGAKIILDVDYRPNLWGLAGHGAGESRYIRSDAVSAHLQRFLPDCDVIVGTEEELHIAGGSEDTLTTLRTIRHLAPSALLVVKRGPMGCVVFPGAIPASLEDGIRGPGFPVEVFNVLGAGDAFMSGFLRGYLRGEPLETCCAYANACGAFAVSRLLCSPESPGWDELQHFLKHGSPHRALRKDETLNHLHHIAIRPVPPSRLSILSIDHGAHDLVAVAERIGANPSRIPAFKALAVKAAARVANGRTGYGVFLDGNLGREALFRAGDHPLWVGRQFPHGVPGALASEPADWPVAQVIKLIANARSDARTPLAIRLPEIREVMASARALRRQTLIEALPEEGGSTADFLKELYGQGLKPDYWLTEAEPDASGWGRVAAVIADHDPGCHGVIVIARNAQSGPELARAAASSVVRGFVGGRSVFGPAFQGWLSNLLDDEAAIGMMMRQFQHFAEAFGREA